MDLYFIASSQLEEGNKLSLPNEVDDNILKFKCILSCKNKEEALKEILEHSDSYEENLEKLKFTGFLIPIDSTFNSLLDKTKNKWNSS